MANYIPDKGFCQGFFSLFSCPEQPPGDGISWIFTARCGGFHGDGGFFEQNGGIPCGKTKKTEDAISRIL